VRPRRIYLPPVPRVRPAGSWLPQIGFQKMLRAPTPPIGRYSQLASGIPLTGGQGSSVISSGPAGGTAALVQSKSGTASSGTTVTVTLTTPTTAGNCLVVYVGTVQGTTNPTVSGITLGGAAGNFASAKTQNNNADTDAEIWVNWNIAGGQTSVVVTFAAGTGTGQENIALVEEWSGILASSSPVDSPTANGASGVGLAPSSGSTGTLSQASELVVGAISGGTTLAGPAPPWVNETVVTAGSLGLLAGHQAVSSTGAQTYSGTQSSGSWSAAVVGLKIAPASGGGVAGVATVSVGPQGLGNVWYPAQATVGTSSGVTDSSTCSVYLGPAGVPVTLVGTIFPGGIGTLALAVPPMSPGEYLIFQWTGGNPGDQASVNVIGTMDALMPG
jgi:hypothetical protein